MKKILAVLLSCLLAMAFTVPAFAADGDDDTPTVLRIPEGTKVVTSSTVNDGVIDRLRVKTIYVPSSVTTIEEGALTGYANVTNVYVDNSKDNITIKDGALPTGTNVVYSEKPSATTTTTKAATTTTTTATTTKKSDSEDKTTKKDDSDEKTTKKTTTTTKKGDKTTTRKSNKTTVSSKATTSDPKNRVTVSNKPLTIKSTKATTASGPLVPEVEVDPDTIEEEPDLEAMESVTTVTFAGEAITDKDGTIIGFEDTQGGTRSGENSTSSKVRYAIIAGVGAVAVSAAAILGVKLRKRP